MLKVTKKQAGDTLTVFLEGEIVESTIEFSDLIGELPANLNLDCGKVSRINSTGVRAWVHYLTGISKTAVKVRFLDCTPFVVEQINLSRSFSCGAEIVSIQIPYLCPRCNHEFVQSAQVKDLSKEGASLPNLKCPNCKDPGAFFDGVAEEYFRFISR